VEVFIVYTHKIFLGISWWKNFENWSTFAKVNYQTSGGLFFIGAPCIFVSYCSQSNGSRLPWWLYSPTGVPEQWCTEANEATQTRCNRPVAPTYLVWHIMRMDDNADAKRILLASRPADWRRQLGRLRITWLSTVQQDLKQLHLTLPEAADLAQNRPLWRMMSTYGARNLRVACEKRRWRNNSAIHELNTKKAIFN